MPPPVAAGAPSTTTFVSVGLFVSPEAFSTSFCSIGVSFGGGCKMLLMSVPLVYPFTTEFENANIARCF
jgi:hypothetical protein